MAYGDKTNYPLIQIWRKYANDRRDGWRYYGVTSWSKTCKEAKARFLDKYPEFADRPELIKCNFKRD